MKAMRCKHEWKQWDTHINESNEMQTWMKSLMSWFEWSSFDELVWWVGLNEVVEWIWFWWFCFKIWFCPMSQVAVPCRSFSLFEGFVDVKILNDAVFVVPCPMSQVLPETKKFFRFWLNFWMVFCYRIHYVMNLVDDDVSIQVINDDDV